jgi:hypothetical protein
MKIPRFVLAILLVVSIFSFRGAAQHVSVAPVAASAPTVIPTLVPFSSVAAAGDGKMLTGEIGITFLIYKDEEGGEPLWTETQAVVSDTGGRYRVQLGAASPNGLPADLFSTGEARWLEVQIAGEKPQSRVLLASVPYAFKAADSATLGGLPASAFALAGSNVAVASVTASAITPDAAATVTTTGGTAGYVPEFTGAATIANSPIFVKGASVGIGTVAPAAALDVNGPLLVTGDSTLNGQLLLPAPGTATAKQGYNSQLVKLYTSAYNSSTKAVVAPRFEWEAEVTGNDTAAPAATLNLLSSTTSAVPAETGFYLNINGTIHFAAGQTFGATSSGGIAFNGTSTSNTGVEGTSTSGSGVVGSTGASISNEAGVLGKAGAVSGITHVAAGVWGDSYTQVGVEGTSNSSIGVYGGSTLAAGVEGVSAQADGGDFTGGLASSGIPGVGVKGTGGDDSGGNGNGGGDGGIFYGGAGAGSSGGGGDGIEGYGGYSSAATAGAGVVGYGGQSNANTGTAGDGGDFFAYPSTKGIAGEGIYAQASTTDESGGYAGSFSGNVTIDGTLFADAKDFKIDHPSDPANKYLVHASIESSEMVNIYSGNVTTDELGLATVQLPSWFETLNGDLRYQLTVVGRRAQAWIAQEVKDGKFQIASDATNTKVSWQITGVRQDAYAKAHPLVVEQSKNARERGFYKHPELYGQPAQKQTEWGRNPELMRRAEAMRAAQKNPAKTASASSPGTQARQVAANTP